MPSSSCKDHPKYRAGCPACAALARLYKQIRKTGVADGTWAPVMRGAELEPVGQHVRALLAHPGVGPLQISERTGVNRQTIRHLRDGVQRTLHPDSAQALLAVSVADLRPQRLPGGQENMVDATGTARRLQALAADGWDTETLAELMGCHSSEVARWRRSVYARITEANRDRVGGLYDKIQSQADPSGPSPKAREQAERFGYLPPDRWLEEEIDDPAAEPLPPPPDTDDHVATTRLIEDALRNPAEGKAADYDRPVKREIARHAQTRLGWSYEQIAWLLGFKSANTAEYLLNGRADRPHTRRNAK